MSSLQVSHTSVQSNVQYNTPVHVAQSATVLICGGGGVAQLVHVYPFEHVYVQFHGLALYVQA